MALHWKEREYFPLLMQNNSGEAHAALEYFVDDLHKDKSKTVMSFICHSGSEDFLWGLIKLLASKNTRVAGNSAYILGTLAENDLGQKRVLSILQDKDALKILDDLTTMLAFDDPESVMNAAGTMGTLAETTEGREWMLHHSCVSIMLVRVTNLLTSDNMWTASNAALVLARLTISEEGSDQILTHKESQDILSKLVLSLGLDDAGRGMNAAFAIGRLCDMEKGRARLLQLRESNQMITSLCTMLGSQDTGCSKNACFAISCLAGSEDGHDRLLDNPSSESMLCTLAKLLDAEDTETGWFAAMTLRTLASKKKGCLRLRDHKQINQALKEVETKPGIHDDLKEEIALTLEILKKLEKPHTPKVKVIDAFCIAAEWAEVTLKSGLNISYKLYEVSGVSRCVYHGQETSCEVADLRPYTKYSFKLQTCTDGDSSPLSEVAMATTEEWVPEVPGEIKVIGVTTTQIKICWTPPEYPNGVLKGYCVYNGKSQTDSTSELNSIIMGLAPGNTYDIHVCAVNSKGKGQKSTLQVRTTELGQHAPGKPSLTVRGRSEICVSWEHPEVPLGRLHRFEVTQNGKVIYSGTDTGFIARRLKPETEYIFTVIAVTSEGRCESDPAKKKTLKDEYDDVRSTAPLFARAPTRQDSDKLRLSKKKSKHTPVPGEVTNSPQLSKDRDTRERELSSRAKSKPPSANKRINTQASNSYKVFWNRQNQNQTSVPVSYYNLSDHVSMQRPQSDYSRPSSRAKSADTSEESQPVKVSVTQRKGSLPVNTEEPDTWPAYPTYEDTLQSKPFYEKYARPHPVRKSENYTPQDPKSERVPATNLYENGYQNNVRFNDEHHLKHLENNRDFNETDQRDVALESHLSVGRVPDEYVSRATSSSKDEDYQEPVELNTYLAKEEEEISQKVTGKTKLEEEKKKSKERRGDKKKVLPVASVKDGQPEKSKDYTKMITMSKKFPHHENERLRSGDRREMYRPTSKHERKDSGRQSSHSQADFKDVQIQGRASDTWSESGRLYSARSDRRSVSPKRYHDRSNSHTPYAVYEEEVYMIGDSGGLTQSLPTEYDMQMTTSVYPEPIAWQGQSHEARFEESDISKSLSALKKSYRKSLSMPTSIRHIATDHNLPIKSSLDPPSFYQRASAFINSHRPITKKALAKLPSQFTPGQMQTAHNVQYQPDFPSSKQALTNKSQFIPMQFRTQPLNMPGPPLHRGNTMANLYDKSAYVRKLEELSRISTDKVDMCETCGHGKTTHDNGKPPGPSLRYSHIKSTKPIRSVISPDREYIRNMYNCYSINSPPTHISTKRVYLHKLPDLSN
ncbi:uncharacterized protein LOC144440857 [Glandiceps talaboti]